MDKCKRKAKLRRATLDDIDEMVAVEWSCWDNTTPRATAEHFRARIESFPEGQFVAILDGKIVGLTNVMMVADYDIMNPIPTWSAVTDDGYIRGMHSDQGNVIYGVNMSALPDAPEGVGTQMILKVGTIVISKGLRCCILGGRMPDYHKHQDKYTPEEYLTAKNGDGRYLDRQIHFYKHLKGMRVEGVLPNYMKDPDSCDNGVLLAWYNPFYRYPRFMHKPLSYLMHFFV
ncbi:MAG: hypothetical protein ACYC55_07255 [Candidatus Geothermincolia bacterium]